MASKNIWRYGLLILLLVPQVAIAQDHLEPEVGILYAAPTSYDYCQNLNTLFFDESPPIYTYLARMFCRPGFNQPQWCVTVDQDKDSDCRVKYVAAEKAIDHTKDSLKIKVNKATQPIDFETAQIIERVFRRMLRGVRYPDREEEGGDSDEYNFSRKIYGFGGFDRKPGDPPSGSEQGLVYEPDEGSLTEKLVKIGDALKRYATTDSAEQRAVLRLEIRSRAEELESKAALAPAPK